MSGTDSPIPPGFCQCGCGGKTAIVMRNIPARGLKKGDPSQFIAGHVLKAKFRDMPDPNPSGLCMCGCGSSVPIAKRSDHRAGIVAGSHMRFLSYHRTKNLQVEPHPCACGCGGMTAATWLNGHWNTAKAKAKVASGYLTCPTCGDLKPATLEFFTALRRSATGLSTTCKQCHAEAAYDSNKQWRLTHPEYMKALNAQWKQKNPEKARAQGRRRRARMMGVSGTHTVDDVRAQYERQRGRCFYCGVWVGKRYHVDHVMPLALGGSDGPENIVIACPTCNGSKGAKHPMDYCGILL